MGPVDIHGWADSKLMVYRAMNQALQGPSLLMVEAEDGVGTMESSQFRLFTVGKRSGGEGG